MTEVRPRVARDAVPATRDAVEHGAAGHVFVRPVRAGHDFAQPFLPQRPTFRRVGIGARHGFPRTHRASSTGLLPQLCRGDRPIAVREASRTIVATPGRGSSPGTDRDSSRHHAH
jgi:hypothetical protein